MSSIREMYYGMQNKTLKVGTRFNTDSFQCTAVARGKVTFIWMSSDANYNIEMLTDLDIPRITRYTSDLSMSGCLNYNEKDKITGRDIKCKVKFYAEFEYQSDNNFHVVQFKRVPEKSETTSVWVFELYNEGMMYMNGEGFPKNRDKAIELFRRAANQDHPGAKNMLAKLDDLFIQGQEAFQANNYAKALELLLKAHEAKHPNALFLLGRMYMKGKGVSQDYDKAEEFFTQALNVGDENYRKWAKEDLEEIKKLKSSSVQSATTEEEKEKMKAFEWSQKCANDGMRVEQHAVGKIYEEGLWCGSKLLVAPNRQKAIEWYEKAAAQGYTRAKEKLAGLK